MFQDALLETTPGERHRRELTLLATLAGEALVIAALVALPLLYLDAIPGFSVRAAVRVPLGPPPQVAHDLKPRAPSGGGGPTAPGPVAILQLNPHPLLPFGPRQASDTDVPPDPNQVARPSGCCGVPGGTGEQFAAAPPRPSPPARPPLISHVEAGMIVRRVEPVYPALARQAHIQGEVVLRVLISQSGQIENLRVVSGHPFLTKAAADAVEQWRFRPYYLNGSPIEVEAQITVRFVLGGGL
jgi:periplasmic protein TonB